MTINTPQLANETSAVIVIGTESVGKSQLISSLTGKYSSSSQFRGTTVSCEVYSCENLSYIDTPGIIRKSDTETVRIAMNKLKENDQVLLIINATHIDEDLDELLPLLKGKKGSIVLTFWDMVKNRKDASKTLQCLEEALSMPMIPVDARNLSDKEKELIHKSQLNPTDFPELPLNARAGWKIEAKKGLFEIPVLGQVSALTILFVPAYIAVQYANHFADWLYDDVTKLIEPGLNVVNTWQGPLSYIFGKTYGFIAMGPFLFLYALPTVIIFALILSIYKTTGLVDRLTTSLNVLTRPFGLLGRDIVRVIMGLGCNVPAVINTRSCSVSSRNQTICAISFGAACSYQLPATLSVFSSAKMPHLALVYIALMVITTLIYLRFTAGKSIRSQDNSLLIEGRDFMRWPSMAAIYRELWLMLKQFLLLALPIFFIICVIASLFEWLGLMRVIAGILSPVMKIFNLPGETSLTLILASIRKDGIMFLANGNIVHQMTEVQVMTTVYLSGVLLPCIVTILTIVKEMKSRFAMKLIAKQAFVAIIFSTIIAWGGILIGF
ncbi:MAG: 50S ribosome-binding GTPase [Spirochaetota bacterium]|nr:50S ribosome-binding GTPase [Spirochaetota bacterium]